MKQNTEKKIRVAIVGAGVAGLTAGIYCLDQGFDVALYEKNPYVGGECTGWSRNGTYIDGCAHWIIGTNPTSELYPLWHHIGIFDGHPKAFPTRYISKFKLSDGRIFTFYSDLKKLEEHALSTFPSDKKVIQKIIRGIRAYMSILIPTDKPIDMMGPLSLTKFGLKMLPMFLTYVSARRESIAHLASQCNDKELASVLLRFLEPDYNAHSLYYICAELAKDDSCVLEGGSKPMMERVAKRFLDRGGELHLASPVKRVRFNEKNEAVGLELEKGDVVDADYVITACDMEWTLHHLLENRFKDKIFEKQFAAREAFPVNTSVLVSYRVSGDFSAFPYMLDVKTEPIDMFGKAMDHLPLRNFSFDPTLPSPLGTTSFTALLPANEAVYDNLKAMDRKTYLEAKKRLGEAFIPAISETLGVPPSAIELLDVATPLTFERYNHCYKGSYMAFLSTAKGFGLMRPGLLKGAKNFVMAGQWIMIPGGLPIALFSGKHAAIRICKMLKQRFVNKESKKPASVDPWLSFQYA
ncbi:MAG: NAD(P)/FAD-dependent oxidoreductase [Bacilli bacterium]|nr:NAD(P)/FAD-dependent oxidoreductase [Bacilli bacterium]